MHLQLYVLNINCPSIRDYSCLWNIPERTKIKPSCILWWRELHESNQCPVSRYWSLWIRIWDTFISTIVTFVSAIKTWIPLTKVVMVPMINSGNLVIMTKVVVFGTRPTLGFLLRCLFNKEVFVRYFLVIWFKSKTFFIKRHTSGSK